MRKFELNAKSNTETNFLVSFSELEGRFDPHFYKPEFRELQYKIEKKDYK